MRVSPECRYCGAGVAYFGDICQQCEDSEHNNDGLDRITKLDLTALAGRGTNDE